MGASSAPAAMPRGAHLLHAAVATFAAAGALAAELPRRGEISADGIFSQTSKARHAPVVDRGLIRAADWSGPPPRSLETRRVSSLPASENDGLALMRRATTQSLAKQIPGRSGLNEPDDLVRKAEPLAESQARQVSVSEANGTVCAMQGNRCFDLSLWEGHGKTRTDAEIVVARCHEDIRWLDALPDIPTVVYNRGNNALLPQPRSNLKIVKQENVGREDEVWLRHIVSNYGQGLAETTIFLQGWPMLHCPHVVYAVRSAAQSASAQAGRDGHEGAALLSAEGIRSVAAGLVPITKNFYQYSVADGLVGFELTAGEGRVRARELYKSMCQKILGRDCPDKQWVAEGSQWAVSRSRLLSQPQSLYEGALKLSEGYHAKLRGLVLEALWPVLWGAEGWEPGAVVRPRDDPRSPLALLDTPAKPSGETDDLSFNEVVDQQVSVSGGHCGDTKPLLWSCEDTMAFCEVSQRAGKVQWTAGPLFFEQRKRFLSRDLESTLESNASQEHATGDTGTWGMLAQLAAPLLPGTLLVEVQSDGVLKLSQAPPKPAQWLLRDAPGGGFFLGYGSQMQQHLGCNASTGLAQVMPEATEWLLVATQDGRWSMRSKGGRLRISWDAHYKRLKDSLVHCHESPSGSASRLEQFALQMIQLEA